MNLEISDRRLRAQPMSHRQLNLVADHNQDRWHSTVTNSIRRDFMLSTHIHVDNGWVWLSGEFMNHVSSTTANRVGYGIAPWIIDGQTALVRVCGTEGQPLVIGPSRIMIERLECVA